jgi:ABC-2 type transport system permease protein
MQRLKAELSFLRALMGVNLAAAMEYRVSFISQIVGMFLNNGIYFVFWLLFFDRFGSVRGYGVTDVFLLFSIVAVAFGLAFMFAGNAGPFLARIIAHGRLDYYLVFPRNLLLHVLFSRMSVSTIGDLTFGLIAFLFAGRLHPVEIGLFLLMSLLAALVLVAFGVIAGSLAFFMGNAQYASQQMSNAIMTFSLYPNTLFTGAARLMLYTLIPAGFVGAVPVQAVTGRDFSQIPFMLLAVAVLWALAIAVFYGGLRRYESGSAINVNV